MKFATFIEAPAEQSRDDFQNWLSADFLQRLAASAPTIRGCVQRTVRESPGTPFDALPSTDPDFGSFDVLVESWFSSVEDFRREVIPVLEPLEATSARHISYLVTPRLQLDPRISESGPDGRRPEITAVCSIRWKDGVAPARASALYDRHATIALRCQPAITKYEQNIVEEVLCWSPGITPVDAYADFSFRTVEDCRLGFRATREERQDTSGFVRTGRFAYLDDARPIERRSTDR
jgi:hypothetical protein